MIGKMIWRYVCGSMRNTFNIPVAAAYTLDDAPAAYERFSAGKKLGKIVLEVQ